MTSGRNLSDSKGRQLTRSATEIHNGVTNWVTTEPDRDAQRWTPTGPKRLGDAGFTRSASPPEFLTRKRSQVQSLYRPPRKAWSEPQLGILTRPSWRSGRG